MTPSDSFEAAWDAGLAAAFGTPGPTATYPGPRGPEPDTVLAGKYRLAERIGEGGMGEVWVAHQTEPVKRKVAVKLIKAGMDSHRVIARFEAERQALALMDHPNIAKVLDGGLHDGRPFFVMELVKGIPITEYCDARRLTPPERLGLFVPVCQAIQHAHQKGIIHRDIKPSNVLIALYDDRPVPKVIDFGVAKATGGALTEQTIDTAFGGVVGTPQYMSPEQATFNNLDIDTRSDVYSLGVLLYELLAGSPPFTPKELAQKGLLEMLRVVREDEPQRPSTRLSTADALPTLSANRGTDPKKLTGLLRNELDWVVMKALEKDRTRRYETATGLAADVQRYLGGDPVTAHPPSARYRLAKFVRRRRPQVIAAGLVLLAVLGGLVATSVGFYRADEQRQRAEQAERTATAAALAETRAKDEVLAQKARAEYQAKSAAVDLALQQCESGRLAEGLLHLARLRNWLREYPDLRECVTLNILVWAQHHSRIVPDVPSHDRELSPDGRTGLFVLPDDTAELWDVLAGRRLGGLGPTGNHTVGFDPAGRTAYLGSDRGVKLFDVASRQLKHELRPPRGWNPLPALSPDGTRAVTLSDTAAGLKEGSPGYNAVVDLWDTATGRHIAALDHGGKNVPRVRFSPDGGAFATAHGRELRVWSAADGRLLRALGGHDADVDLFAWSPTGRTLATFAGRQVRRWDTATWARDGPPVAVPFDSSSGDPDEERAFTVPHDEVIQVTAWNNHAGGIMLRHAACLRGEAQARDVHFAATDGRYGLTLDGQVFELYPYKLLAASPGGRYPEELRTMARGNRFLKVQGYVFDLMTEKPIGPMVFRDEWRGKLKDVRFLPDTGFATTFQHHQSYYLFPPTAIEIDSGVLEGWVKVVVRGQLDGSGVFAPLDEAEWDRRRRRLAEQAATPEFPFPGPVAADRLYWLRQEIARPDPNGDRDPKRLAALYDRLVAEGPTWENYSERAEFRYRTRDPVGALRDDLKARQLAHLAHRTDMKSTGENAVREAVSRPGRTMTEYQVAVDWFAEARADPIVESDTEEMTALRALALYRVGRAADALAELTAFSKKQGVAGVLLGAPALAWCHSEPGRSLYTPLVRALCLRQLGQAGPAREALDEWAALKEARELREARSRGGSTDWDLQSLLDELRGGGPK
ncbi:MAG TPA: serine/threonine-protein kinase [Gemmataceae bacterium]|nr:serine/threonine-protein kinase [Gemmataceae bacterium]